MWENRRKDVKELLGEVRLENDTLHILLILQLNCNIHFFLDKGIIGCPQCLMEKVLINAATCQGCGSCATVCPNSASVLSGFSDQQMLDIIDSALEGTA